ncbi:MAG: hypothetical protein JNK05_01390 [Myxococcales bacterium]|nr:hypothetical protein [Myxococcales bacterium]
MLRARLNPNRPILLGAGALVVAAIALVLTIRALIPRDQIEVPPLPPRSAEDATAPIVAAPVVYDVIPRATPDVQPAPTVVVAQPTYPPQTQQLYPEPLVTITDDATVALVVPDAQGPATPEPIASIRADVERYRAQLANLTDGGNRGGMHHAMVGLVGGAGLVMRLTAGDPAFNEQVTQYRRALQDAGPLDPNARATLRARYFDPAHAERGALYDEVLQAPR